MAFELFGRTQGPGAGAATSKALSFGSYSLAPPPTPGFPNTPPQPSSRVSISPQRSGNAQGAVSSNPGSHIWQRPLASFQNGDAEVAVNKSSGSKPSSFSVSKRSRSPPPHANQVFDENYSSQDGSERELQAKAKRLARFRTELGQNGISSSDHSIVGKQINVGKHSAETSGDLASGDVTPDPENSRSASLIVGLCPDMCPESERGERERKGDLDQYERLDGDRTQTSRSLAIKKYTRTAEREARLIRPMPVLQMTIDYLLGLLDHPYDHKFLGMYNFLWDRMRAIRMDLRMQHIFNLEAITMLEQMIRLHIIAMHELCEFTKGEGFSEGFDAHLNIEQMNKTSVELFQMYDDHRKKGIDVPTEREFRGYYALLKLDKHPGYKVEPAELSLDLAKMTPEIRQTSEVLFARNVARACRTANFIAFFRLARKASYLQACLMHAHFAKLRTQALASLHSGLQNNQGLPVAHLSNWLGMEQEDIVSLLDYHGFLIKEFEEPYMVKDGYFSNVEKDFPTRCSKLVHSKRSRTITEDVAQILQSVDLPSEARKEVDFGRIHTYESADNEFTKPESSVPTSDEEMSDPGAVSSPNTWPVLEASTTYQKNENDKPTIQLTSLREVPFLQNFPDTASAKPKSVETLTADISPKISQEIKTNFDVEHASPPNVPTFFLPQISPASQLDTAPFNSCQREGQSLVHIGEPSDDKKEVESDDSMAICYDEEVSRAKIKLIIRIWKRRALRRKASHNERKQLEAIAALDYLSMGPTLRKEKEESSSVGDFDINQIMTERYHIYKSSWSRLNVSDVIVGELSKKNSGAMCLCWKLVMCSQDDHRDKVGDQKQATQNGAARWLRSKIMPSTTDDGDLLTTSPCLSIWKKWVVSQYNAKKTCCLSVVKDMEFDGSSDLVSGASAILFLVSASIPWAVQRGKLHNLLLSLPSDACVPLLILSDSCEPTLSTCTIANELGLHGIDRSRVSSYMIVFLVGNYKMEQYGGFFSDGQLREGLQWLASHSPPQPKLHRVKVQELILTRLDCSLNILNKMSLYKVGPDRCISAFNEALDQSVSEVAAAANASPVGWPCPEIALAGESSDELRYLPKIGWSSKSRLKVISQALQEYKLPPFADDIAWLARSCGTGKEIEQSKLQLRNCLVNYLTQSSEMMGLATAEQEAHVMLQKSTQLEFHNLRYYLVPKWSKIFRRIFYWRLSALSNGPTSDAYVLEPDTSTQTSEDMNHLEDEGSMSLPCFMVQPSLDEMVEVVCNDMLYEEGQAAEQASHKFSGIVPITLEYQEATNNDSELVEAGTPTQSDSVLAETSNDYLSCGFEHRSEIAVASQTAKEADRLSKLLEQCNIVQNRINEKLSIYF